MSRGYLLLFFSFLISTKVLAVGPEIETNVCASAAVAGGSEKALFTSSYPEQWLLENMQISDDFQYNFISALTDLRSHINMIAKRVEEEGEIPYTEHVDHIIPRRYTLYQYDGNLDLATSLFHQLLYLYQLALHRYEAVDNEMTRNIVDIYQKRMRALLSDKDKGVDVNRISRDGSSFLMIAAFYGYDDIVELLLERSVDPSYRPIDGDFQNRTALIVAREALLVQYDQYETLHENNRDPRSEKKIERYNRTIQLLKEADATDDEENATFMGFISRPFQNSYLFLR